MNPQLGKFDRHTAQRPYWLLLVLVLFFAGQVASSAHWHAADAQVDADCALCLLSGTSSAALTTSAWQPLAIPIAALVCFLFVAALRRSVTHCYDSRAPPYYS